MYVEEGEFYFSIGGEMKILRKGDSCFILFYVEYGVVCFIGGILIDIFSLVCEDFVGE